MSEEILFEIKINGEQSVSNLKNQVTDLTKKFNEAQTAGARKDIAEALSVAKNELGKVNTELKTFVAKQSETKEFPKTIQGMRDELKSLNAQWKGADIGSKAFNDLELKVKATNETLKKHEAAVGDNRRNVGNYGDALKGLGGPIGNTITGVQGFNTALKANPIGAIVGLLLTLVNALQSNAAVADLVTRTMAGLNKVMTIVIDTVVDLIEPMKKVFTSPKEALLDLVDLIKNNLINRFKALAVIVEGVINLDFKQMTNGVLQLGTGVEDVFGKVGKFANTLGDAAAEGFNAAKALDEMKVANQKLTGAIALNEQQVRGLTFALKDRTKTEQERIKIAQEISQIEIDSAIKRTTIAKTEFDAESLRLKGKQLSAEEEAKLAELKTNVTIAESEKQITQQQKQTRINILLGKEELKELKEDKAAAALLEKNNKAGVERIKLIEKNNSEILKLSNQLGEELAKEADSKFTSELEKLNAQRETFNNVFLAKKAELSKLISETTDADLIEQYRKEFELEESLLTSKLNQLAAKEIELNKNIAIATQAKLDAEKSAQLQLDILRVEQGSQQMLDAEIAMITFAGQQRLAALKGTDEEIANQKLLIEQQTQNQIEKIKADSHQRQIDMEFALAQTLGNLASGLGGLLIEEGSKAAAFQKTVALFQIGVNTAKAISSLTSASAANPTNAATFGAAGAIQFASGLIQILANIAQAKKILTTSSIPKGERGIVLGGRSHALGGTTISADGVPIAEAEKGELLAIVNKRSTLSALSSLNMAGGGIPLMANGGSILPTFNQGGGNGFVDAMMEVVSAQNNRIDNIRVTQVESDFTSTQKRISNIEAEASIISA